MTLHHRRRSSAPQLRPRLSPALKQALVHELVHGLDARDTVSTLDDALACVVLACWRCAETIPEPYVIEADARAAVSAALAYAVEHDATHIDAQRVFRLFLERNRRLLPRQGDAVTTQMHRTWWCAAERLWHTSIYDPTQRCPHDCQRPDDCPSAHDSRQTACARQVPIFPWLSETRDETPTHYHLNVGRAAAAIVRGVRQLRTQQPALNLAVPELEAVRKELTRHVKKDDARIQRFMLEP